MYYYLVSGLPELRAPGQPAEADLKEIRAYIEGNLIGQDRRHFDYLLYRNDNKNLLALIRLHEGFQDTSRLKFYEPAALSHPQLEEGFEGLEGLPRYMEEFVRAYRSDALPSQRRLRANYLQHLYYEEALQLPDPFLRDYFSFKRDLKNIVSGLNAQKYSISREEVFVGEYELVQQIAESRQADFGLGQEFPFIEDLRAAIDAEDFLELERTIDRILWDYLDGRTSSDRFGVASVFAYFIKLSLGHRWLELKQEAGLEELAGIVDRVLTRAAWPKESVLEPVAGVAEESYS